ncbi:uncharacterized protein RHOBADRAFT_52582 [Rhodotorula graminis WP1]|uniref:Something about silencing protein 4 domain-containing protein n=1 Tax=Rhodotorula graminis (strain WP1) TaxID=578459 RepID=A0A194S7Y1_RHOGW|nr:uncharacterized protein RHOBADRAFT_52582 [Rhodotorula graminis WP1]KPV76595.1 hypothetical protein RHOBADRAFT_52582 [Rhodotorula graminis WP1]
MLPSPRQDTLLSAHTPSSSSAAPSAKALGKRRLDEAMEGDSPPPPTASTTRPAAAPVAAVKKQERRVTRSSLGGASAGTNEAGVSDSERAQAALYLPVDTRILLTTRQPANVTIHPPSSASSSVEPLRPHPVPPSPDAVANGTPQQIAVGDAAEQPLFRLLGELELLPPRGARHALPAEADSSDAFYLRLHRYPEVLEKRASRLERERLIHERSKLINELEELRGRTWVYAGNSAGGRAEEERQRKIKEMQDRLARYDALLPNQPRKSNFLNLSVGTAGPPSAATTGAPLSRRDSHTRTESPSATGLSTSRSRREPVHRPPTPMSATASQAGGGGTKIRIKFGAPTAPAASTSSRRASRSFAVVAAAADEEDELLSDDGEEEGGHGDASRYTIRGELRKGPKRDRRAERARAEERRRLGLPARASISKALTGKSGIQRRSGGARRRSSRSYGAGDGDGDEDEDDESEEQEDDQLDGEEGGRDEWDGYDSETGRPLRPSTSRNPAQLVRRRLPDSFFHSASLRDAVMASHGPNARRASTRVAYAFGERLPDAALLHAADFEPRGGVAGDEDDDEDGYSRTTLEAMVQERSLERHGETMVLLDGRVLPKSALDVWRDGPLAVSPVRRSVASSMAPSAAAQGSSASDAGSTVTGSSRLVPPAAPLARRSGALWASDGSPSVSNAPSPAPTSPPATLLRPPAFEDPPPPRPCRPDSAPSSPQRSQAPAVPPMSLAMPMQQD